MADPAEQRRGVIVVGVAVVAIGVAGLAAVAGGGPGPTDVPAEYDDALTAAGIRLVLGSGEHGVATGAAGKSCASSTLDSIAASGERTALLAVLAVVVGDASVEHRRSNGALWAAEGDDWVFVPDGDGPDATYDVSERDGRFSVGSIKHC